MSGAGSLYLEGAPLHPGAKSRPNPQAISVQRIKAQAQFTPTPAPVQPATAPVQAPPIARSGGRSKVASAVRLFGNRGLVEIPSVGIAGPLVNTQVDRSGQMAIPRNAKDVALLDYGSFPGPTRNALLAGHRNWRGVPGTFIRLEQAQAGADVFVTVDGTRYHFIMQWVRKYNPSAAPLDDITGETPVDSVTLITCGGSFNTRTRHYEDRIVARATLA